MRSFGRKGIAVIAVALLALSLAGCQNQPGSVSDDSAKVDKQQQQYAKVQPIPYFDWSQDRANLIQIYQAKNEARNTWTVITSQGSGACLWQAPSIGFGIPADTQLTNGLQAYGGSYGYTSLEQAEPNGLYSSKNTDATYVLVVGNNGKVSPVYTEQKVSVFPFPTKVEGCATLDPSNSTITIDPNKDKPK